jgi:hypothetical protein
LREQEGNDVIDVFFAHTKAEAFWHDAVAKAFNQVRAWVYDGLPKVINGGQFRHTVTGKLGDALE